MKRKDFLKIIPAAVAAGAFSRITSCVSDTRIKESVPRSKTADTTMDTINANIPNNSTRIIDDDTIKTAYTQPALINYARERYCDIVAQNAERAFPKSAPYLEMILKASHDFRYIFDIPPEFHIGMLQQESAFNPDAVSTAPAVGIAQFMFYTAKGMGMKVYSQKDFPELYGMETEIKILNTKVTKAAELAMSDYRNNRFDVLQEHKLAADALIREREALRYQIYIFYLENLGRIDDERKKPDVAVPMSFRHLAESARWADKEYRGRQAHSIIRALAVYNSGYGNVRKGNGLPFIQETINYTRKVMINADKLAPKQDVEYKYDANSQILAEMMASKIYSIGNEFTLSE